jgi:hypothetical protein
LAQEPSARRFDLGEIKDILLNFGAIAGFAGIIGLAVLAMLYFSQARDVRRLREWAGREPERAAEVELRAQQIAAQAIAQAYEVLPASQPAAAEPVATEPVAAEPSAAPVSEETQAHDVVAEEFGGEVPPEVPNETVAAEATPAEASVSVPPPADEPEQPEAEPQSETSRLTPSTPAAARGAVPPPPLPPLDTSEFTAVRSPSSPPIPDYYLSTGTTGSGTFEALELPPERRSRVPFAVAGVLVAVFAVILFATQILGGDQPEGQNGTGGSAANRPARNTADRSQRINRAAVTVSVLNGTNTQGIARAAADGLNKAGFTDTTTGNLSDGTIHPSTIVYYASGSRAEAQEVANELAVKNVKPATDEILAQGGSVPVIVVLGADFQQ